jgi:hypothetical protein
MSVGTIQVKDNCLLIRGLGHWDYSHIGFVTGMQLN